MNKTTLITVLVGLVVIIGGWFWMEKTNTQQEETTPQPSTVATTTVPVVSEIGKHCGGNMRGAYVCATGYKCAPTPGSHLPFGDVGGTCVAN